MSSAPSPSAKVYQYKLVLLGESSVGKSSLVLRFVKNVFSANQESTIGAAFLTQTVQVDPQTTVKFEIWDTAGQERYHSLAPMYYRGAHGAIIVYDVTNPESFERAKRWTTELQRQAQPNIVMVLVGNKLDLIEDAEPEEKVLQRKVTVEEAQAFAEEQNLVFLETSAKTGANVSTVFQKLAERLPKTDAHLAFSRAASAAGSSSRIDLGREQVARESRSCC